MSICLIAPRTGRTKITTDSSPRIIIHTDASTAELLPETVRLAADLISTEDLGSVWRGEALKGEASGAIIWVEGEKLLSGASADLRGAFFSNPSASMLVPVHLPCLDEADLIGLQPRLAASTVGKQKIIRNIRILATLNPSSSAVNAWKACERPWSALHLALLFENGTGGAIAALKEMWQKRRPVPLFATLLLRNLILALLRNKQLKKANQLLTLAMDLYPHYSEWNYLSAVASMRSGAPSAAIRHLELALRSTPGEYVGSGGESSYRASWLLGTIFEQLGEQERALSQFIPGIYQRPAFLPSLAGILRQRLSRFRVEQLHQPLGELVRREPIYFGPVFDFFLDHRVLGPARRLLQTLPIPHDVREGVQARLSSAEAYLHAKRRGKMEKPGVALEGSLLILSGHARINHALGSRLLDEESLDVEFAPSEGGGAGFRALPHPKKIAEGMARHVQRLDLTIRHQWPPDFRRPTTGKLACIVPWEHRAVPAAWVREIEGNVDELWAPSQFVAAAFVQGGVNPKRVRVIPNGFEPEIFNPKVAAWRPERCRQCMFLFVGGTIRRKGADLLLQAYLDAFSEEDDVTLVIKETGSSSFYRHNTILQQLKKTTVRPNVAPILLITEEIDDHKLASLYRACDAFVLPYRGEGFGMPLIEAMACGRPVVTTAAGPATEFCLPEFSYLLSAAEVPVQDPLPPFGEFTGEWTWFEPDIIELAETLRSIYENRDEAARRGCIAAERVLRTHPWEAVTDLYLERIADLTGLSTLEHSQDWPPRAADIGESQRINQ